MHKTCGANFLVKMLQIRYFHQFNCSIFTCIKYIRSPATSVTLPDIVKEVYKSSTWITRCSSSYNDEQGQNRGDSVVGTDVNTANEPPNSIENDDGNKDTHTYGKKKVFDRRLSMMKSRLRSKYQIYSGLSESIGSDKSDPGERHFGISQLQKKVGIEEEVTPRVHNTQTKIEDNSHINQCDDNFFGFGEGECKETDMQEIGDNNVNKYLTRRLGRRSSLTREQLMNQYEFIGYNKPKSMEKVLQTSYGQVWVDPKVQQTPKRNQPPVKNSRAEQDTFGKVTGSDFIDNQYFYKSDSVHKTVPNTSISADTNLQETGNQHSSEISAENQINSMTSTDSGSAFIDNQYFDYTPQIHTPKGTSPDIESIDNIRKSRIDESGTDPETTLTPNTHISTGSDFIDSQYFEYSNKDKDYNSNVAPSNVKLKQEELGNIDNQHFSMDDPKLDSNDLTNNRVSGYQTKDMSDMNYFDEQLFTNRGAFPVDNVENKKFSLDTAEEMPFTPPTHHSDKEYKRAEPTEEKPKVHWRVTEQEKRSKGLSRKKENAQEVPIDISRVSFH